MNNFVSCCYFFESTNRHHIQMGRLNFLDSLKQTTPRDARYELIDAINFLVTTSKSNEEAQLQLERIIVDSPVRINQEFFLWFYEKLTDFRFRFFIAQQIFRCQDALIRKNAQDYFRFAVKFVRHIQQKENVTLFPLCLMKWLFNCSPEYLENPSTSETVDFSINMRKHRIRIGNEALHFIFHETMPGHLICKIIDNFTANGYSFDIFGMRLEYVKPPTRADRIDAMLLDVNLQDKSAAAFLYLFLMYEDNLLRFQRARGDTINRIKQFKRVFGILRQLHRDCQEYLCEKLFAGVFNSLSDGFVLKRLLQHFEEI